MREIVPQYHENPSQRTPCVLVLDASASMGQVVPVTGAPRIDELNHGLVELRQALLSDETARMRVQLSIVCVGGPAGEADVLMDWKDAEKFEPPVLRCGGFTPLGQGMRLALQRVEEQKRVLRANGIGYTRPWIMVVSDGEPTDAPAVWEAAAGECRTAEADKRCVVYPIGVGDANLQALQQLSATPALKMKDAKFGEYFRWLSASLSSMSHSRPGDVVPLPSAGPWAAASA